MMGERPKQESVMRAYLAIALLPVTAAAQAAGPEAPLVPDSHTLVLCHLESAADVASPAYIRAGGGLLTGAGAEYRFVEGRFGNALLLTGNATLHIPCTGGNFPLETGTVEMYLRPEQPWQGWATPFIRGGTAWDPWGPNMIDVHFDRNALIMTIAGKPGAGALTVTGKFDAWEPGQWRHVSLCWDLPNGKAAIYLDGEPAGEASGKPVVLEPGYGAMRINAPSGRNPLNAAVDELRVSDSWRHPGSAEYQGAPVQALPANRPLNEDPGFETCTLGTLGDPQPCWNRGEGAPGARWELVTERPHAGQRCLQVTQPAAIGKAITSTREWWITAMPGRTYSFTAHLRADTPGLEARLALGTENWHCRQVSVRPTAAWKAYSVSLRIPDGPQWGATGFGSLLVGRVENWGTGSLFIDDAAIAEGGDAAAAATLYVDAAAERGAWPDLHAGADTAIINWSSATLGPNEIAALTAAGITRVRYSIFCPGLGPISRGKDQWDWTLVDRHMAAFTAAGITPILAFHFTPAWLSRDGTIDTPPQDFEEWGSLVSEVVRHVNVEKKYGIRYFEVWNEPDLPFWKGGTLEEFTQLYEVFARAVRAADPQAKVGGPGVSGGHFAWRGTPMFKYLKGFITACGENNLPLDFLSFHRYALEPDQIKLSCEEIRAWAQRYEALRDAPFFVSEWNSAGGDDKTGGVDSNFNASYVCGWIAGAMDGGVSLATFFDFIDHAWSHPGVLFANWPGLVAPDCTPKPSYNALRLWSMLDKARLYAEGGTAATGVFATRGKDGVSVLAWNHGEAARRTLVIDHCPFATGEVRVERFDINARNANARALWGTLKPAGKLPAPGFAAGSWGQTVEARTLAKGEWKASDGGYRANAPAGSSEQVAVSSAPGAELEWTVEAPRAGRYFPWVKADCTYNGGAFDVLLDGKPIGACDTYIGGLDMRWFALPGQQLAAGPHALAIRYKGHSAMLDHPRAGAAIDLLALTDDAAFAPRPRAGETTAQAEVDLREDGALIPEYGTLPGAGTLTIPLDLPGYSVVLLKLTPAK